MGKVKSMDKDPIRSLFFKYYVPALTSILSVTIHQVVNSIILAQQVGKEGVTAVGLFGPIFTIFIAFALALMIGSGILVGKSIGAKNYGKAQEIFQFSTTVALVFGLIIAISSPFLSGFLSNFLSGTGNEKIVQNTFDYMFWGFIWMPLFLLRMLWGNMISNDGSPKVSLNASLLAVLLNIVLDILLVIVIPLGTAGASIATGIAIFVSWLYLVFYIRSGKSHLTFGNFRFTLYLKEWKELLNFGVPSFVSEISFSLGLILINKSLIPFGALAVAAFGIVNHLSFIFLRLFTSAMISALPIMSFNIGAQLPERVIQTLKFSLLFTFLLGIVVSISGFVFAEPLVNLFSGDESQEFKDIAQRAIALYFVFFIAAGPNYILGAYLQSTGKSVLSSVLNVLKGIGLISLFLFVLPQSLNLDLNSVWLARTFTEIITLFIVGGYTLYNRQIYYSHEMILAKK